MSDDGHDHFGPDCPQCRALAEQGKALGGLADAIERMLADGTFERMGAEAARRQNEEFWRRFLAAGTDEEGKAS